MNEYDEQSTRMRDWLDRQFAFIFWLLIFQTVILALILWRVW